MNPKKAIIFDLDGVIVDTAKYHYLAWRKIALDLGFDFSEAQNEMLKGVSRVQSLEFLLESGQVTLSQSEKERLLREKNEHYLSLISHMNETELLEGIPALLRALRAHQIPFALGSASKNARLILDALHLTDWFTAIVDGNEVTQAKPDPEVFLKAAQKLGYQPEDCIVIEDSQAGIQAANAVGMTSVGIGSKEVLYESQFLLENTAQLTYEFLKEL
jgi:beta-phosphoglucomutase